MDFTLLKYPSKFYDFEGYFIAILIAKSKSHIAYVYAIKKGAI